MTAAERILRLLRPEVYEGYQGITYSEEYIMDKLNAINEILGEVK